MDRLDYRIDIEGDGRDVRIELHVLARAYRDACVALMQRPPAGRHRLEDLGLTIDYEVPGG
jgi:hypothetical protein